MKKTINLLSFALVGALLLPPIPVHAVQPINGRISFMSGTINPDGSYLNDSLGIEIMDNNGTNRRILVNDGLNAAQLWSPDNSRLLYSHYTSSGPPANVFTVNTTGTPSQVQLTNGTLIDLGQSWSVSGDYVYYSHMTMDTIGIYRIKADGTGSPEAVADDPSIAEIAVGLSPDGSKIAYTTTNNSPGAPGQQLYTKNADGTGISTQLTNLPSGSTAQTPLWSPDGQKIAFGIYASYNESNSGNTLHAINTDGTGLQVLTPGAMPNIGAHAWSPDSKHVAYINYVTMDGTLNHSDLHIAHIDGSPSQQLTFDHKTNIHPAWSPDGNTILFASKRDGLHFDIYSIGKNGGVVTNITNTSGVDEQFPRWEQLYGPETETQGDATTTTINQGEDFSGQSFTVGDDDIFINNGSSGDVIVQDGGTAKGNGDYGNLTIQPGGTLAPGMSPGCIGSGNLTLSGTYQVEIGGTVICTGYDQTNVTGSVNVTGSTLNILAYGGFAPSIGNTFTIITNDGADAVTGTFHGLAEGASFVANGVTYRISYSGGDGNDVVLTVVAVPSVPDTGIKLLVSHPLATLFATALSSLGLLGLARYRKF